MLEIIPGIIRLISKGQILDIDSKHLLEYGITTKEARPQTPFQLEFFLQSDDGTYGTEEIAPYTNENNSSNDDSQQMGISVDSR